MCYANCKVELKIPVLLSKTDIFIIMDIHIVKMMIFALSFSNLVIYNVYIIVLIFVFCFCIFQLEIFVLQLHKYAIEFSACGVIHLHRSTITTVTIIYFHIILHLIF